MDATLRRQFRHIVSLASLAYIFFAIHTIQYSLLDHDMDDTGNNFEDQSGWQETSHSDLTSTHNTSNPVDTSTSNSGRASRWTDQEISLLLDYVEASCLLNTARGLNLKKSQFNKARDTVKSKDATQCQYKWGHVSIYINDGVYLTDFIRKLCGIYKAICLWDKKTGIGHGFHDEYGVNARTDAEKKVFNEWLKTPEVSGIIIVSSLYYTDRYDKNAPRTVCNKILAILPQDAGLHAWDPCTRPPFF